MNTSRHGRRLWLSVGLGCAAALAGGTWLWRSNPKQNPAPNQQESAFWLGQYEQLDGQPLKLEVFQGKPLVLNFWATWCPPCIEELPLLNSFYKENTTKGWQVLGLAVDQRASVARFLNTNPLAFPVALAGLNGIELSKSLGNLSSGLPFTVVFNAAGHVVHRKMGRLNPQDLVGLLTITDQ